MGLSYIDAMRKLHEWTLKPSLLNHARAVEAVMRKAAYRYGSGPEDEETWAIAGLLHDADYDQWPEEHPARIVRWLEEHKEPVLAHAIAAHYTRWGVAPDSSLDKALLACDELTGFVMACCLVRSDGIRSLSPSSVIKKLKDRTFAAKVDRQEVYAGAERLGVDLAEHIQLVIDALTPHAAALGLLGTEPRDPEV
jgi:predicted hydrolase (HD superfamily)